MPARRAADRVADVGRRWRRPSRLELAVVEALGTDREPGDACPALGGRIAPLVAARVGLERDLGILGEPEAGAHELDEAGQVFGREEARCPPADVQRAERRPASRAGRSEPGVVGIGAKADLAPHRREERGDPVAWPAALGAGLDDEVAIGAHRDAERDVDVEGGRRPRVGPSLDLGLHAHPGGCGSTVALTDRSRPGRLDRRRSASPPAVRRFFSISSDSLPRRATWPAWPVVRKIAKRVIGVADEGRPDRARLERHPAAAEADEEDEDEHRSDRARGRRPASQGCR